MAATFDEEKLKELLKSALVEALEERCDLVQDIVEEAMRTSRLPTLSSMGLEANPYPAMKCSAF